MPLIVVVSILRDRKNANSWPRLRQAAVILLIALYSVNLGYLFTDTFRTLGSYEFVSGTLAGDAAFDPLHGYHGNRFRYSRLANLPVPVPAHYLIGIDTQKRDIEAGHRCYFAGQWKHGGWWYFYAAAFLLKEPLGTILALASRCLLLTSKWNSLRVLDALCLGLPAALLFIVVSAETEFTTHLRYVLPAYPFLYIWVSRLYERNDILKSWRIPLLYSLLGWTAVSSIFVLPHSHSYFNELAGGYRGGPNWLLDSNIDYGEDSLDLRRWCKNHPDARPLYVSVRCPVPISVLCDDAIESWDTRNRRPGWYVLSVDIMHRSADLQKFTSLSPHDIISPSLYVYHIERPALAR